MYCMVIEKLSWIKNNFTAWREAGRTSYDRSRPRRPFDLDDLSWTPICPGTIGPGQILG